MSARETQPTAICPDIAPYLKAPSDNTATVLETHLYPLEADRVDLEPFQAGGGALDALCNDLLAVTPWGRIALIHRGERVEYLEGGVPMNLEGLQTHPDIDDFRPDRFRVADILLKQHSENRWELFVTHHYFTGECTLFRLSSTSILLENGAASVSPSWRTLFDAKPCLSTANHAGHHAGGRILTDGPDHLLIVVGDHGWIWTGESYAAQDPDSHLGKLVRVAIESGEAEVLALGLRNPQGFARDADGNLWETEHGPQGGDELNLLLAGSNYGNFEVTYGVQYGRRINVRDKHALGGHDGYARPVFAWVPSIAVSSLIMNDARWFPLWKDDLIIGSLGTDENGRSLFRVRRDRTAIQYVERIPVGDRVRDLAQMRDGRIALLTDSARVRFLSRSYRHCDQESIRRNDAYSVDCEELTSIFEATQSGSSGPNEDPGADDEDEEPTGAENGADSDAAAPTGAQLYAANCAACHSLDVEEHGVGPHLVGVVGRRVGQAEGWTSSDALRSLGGAWTTESLADFLADPLGFAPGTTMGSQGLSESEASAIADYIGGLRGE